MPEAVFTIGHSTHTTARFLELLKQHGISAVGDVRSEPFSRRNPQFSRERFKKDLEAAGIVYVFLGDELGARTQDSSCYEDGRVQYQLLARTASFQHGLARVQHGMKTYRLALMCAEKEPLECHRTILVSRYLAGLGIPVLHIHADGTLESHDDALDRLARQLSVAESDMFRSRDDQLADAYRMQESRIAYRPTTSSKRNGTRRRLPKRLTSQFSQFRLYCFRFPPVSRIFGCDF